MTHNKNSESEQSDQATPTVLEQDSGRPIPASPSRLLPRERYADERLVADGSGLNPRFGSVEQTERGRRVAAEMEGAPTPSPSQEREYDPLAPICDACGLPIDREGQPCPALERGVCRP